MVRLVLIVVVVMLPFGVIACDRPAASTPAASALTPATTQESPTTLPAAILPASAAGADGATVTLRYLTIGDIALPSGKVIACDGIMLEAGTAPFTTTVPTGRHPVVLAIAKFSNGDERVAAAIIRFADAAPVKWEPALQPGDDPAKLKKGDFFGYGVDSGAGAFLDPIALNAYDQQFARDQSVGETVIAELDRHQHTTWSWANLFVDSASGANVVIFSSGIGDGAYPSYFGRDATGNVACLVTDFLLLDEKATPWGQPGEAK